MKKKISKEELEVILENHKLWLRDNTKGEKADLSNVDLSEADLRNTDLSFANLSWANLIRADLNFANLRRANLMYADLWYADLNEANLKDADLSYANLEHADLSEATLDEEEKIRKGIILEKPLIGYKKCKDNRIAKLEIPINSIIFSINNSKCRTNKAKIVEIFDKENNSIKYDDAISTWDEYFQYRINAEIEIKDFDLRYNVVCAKGIHFFRTLEEAINY